jgi:RNA polymerase sigma factor (sigma-70 family)
MGSAANEFEELLRRAREGSREATEELFNRFSQPVRTVVRRHLDRRLRGRYSARDIEQSVWYSFFKGLSKPYTFETPEQLVGFLAQVAVNKVYDAARHLRTAKHDVTRERPLHAVDGLAELLPGREETPSTGPQLQELWERLQRGLPPEDRRVLDLLRQGHTYAEIEALTGYGAKKIQRLVRERRGKLVREVVRHAAPGLPREPPRRMGPP